MDKGRERGHGAEAGGGTEEPGEGCGETQEHLSEPRAPGCGGKHRDSPETSSIAWGCVGSSHMACRGEMTTGGVREWGVEGAGELVGFLWPFFL